MKTLATTIASLGCAVTTVLAGTFTTESTYLNPTVSGDFGFTPMITVGDRVPVTGGASSPGFAMVGLPDAMGIYRDPRTSELVLFMSHEVNSTVTTEPVPGATFLKGAFVSRYLLDTDASINSGGLAHGDLLENTTFIQDHPPQAGEANAFTRFCSGSFAGPAQGFDRPIFLTNEESGPSFGGNFNSDGSQTVAVIDGRMHILSDLGHIARETTVVMPRRDALTVMISTEDDGTPSYIYMYMGAKQRRAANALEKNGLVGGRIFVLAGLNPAMNDEATFTNGTTGIRWVEIANAASLTDVQLNAAATAAGGFSFVRVEDAEFDPAAPTRSMFVAVTGGSGPNLLGRLYRVNFDPRTPTANGTLDVIFNADQQVAANGDYCVSIDNIAVTRDFIICCEDRNSPADAVFAANNRNGGVWSLDRNNNFAAKLQATFNYSYVEARDAGSPQRTAGRWEASGVIDASQFYGPGAFLINVQGHLQSGAASMRSNIPKPEGGTYTQSEAVTRFGEDGQILLMRPNPAVAQQ